MVLVSFNVHGLNHPAKRSSVWKKALKLHADILCIQEMHFLSSNPPTFQHQNFTNIFLASAPQKQRRVISDIKDSVAFAPKPIQADPERRYLILVGEFNKKKMKKMFIKITAIRKGGLIMCGDYSITVDTTNKI